MAVRLRVIFAVFIVTAAVVVASTCITFWFGNRVLESHQREELRRQAIAHLEQVESTLKDTETGQRGFILTGDETYLQPFNDASERLPRDVRRLQYFTWIDVTPEEIGKLTQLISRKITELRSTIEVR